MGWILGICLFILVMCCISDFHVYTAYTCNSEEAYKQFSKWRKNYEKTMRREVVVIDIQQYGTHVDFYYKTKTMKKKK